MAHPTQARLLRVLQEKTLVRVGGSETVPYNARLISATQRDLTAAVQEGRFREDLYFRVVVYPLRLPPLRERTEDIPLLVHHFVRVFRASTGRAVEGVTPEALVALEAYAWPGNVRELQNSVFRAVVSARGSFLTTADFPDLSPDRVPRYLPRPYPPRSEDPVSAGAAAPVAAPGLDTSPRLVTMEDHERAAIQQALDLSNGSVRAAADRLQVARSTLYRRIRALGLSAVAS